jgi:polar amino acid transport system permease protein
MIRTFTLTDFEFLLLAARWTVLLAGSAFLLGGIIGGFVTWGRLSYVAPVRWLASGYIEILQGTPLLMQLFVTYFLLVLIGVDLQALTAAVLALSLNASAFSAEIWRGSVQAIPRAQWESGASIGMSRLQLLAYVIAPQALRIAIAPTVGLMIQIIKGTSLTALVGFVELTREGQLITNITFQPLLVFSAVALIYFALCFPLSILSQALERRLHADRSPRLGF